MKSEINTHADIIKQVTSHCDLKSRSYSYEAIPFHFVLGHSSVQRQMKKVWPCGTKAAILYVHDTEQQ